MFFLAFSLVLTGCRDRGLKNNPATDALTTSNGGMTVVKGDYLYFVNGYVDETTLTSKDNKEGKVTRGAIYRTKLQDGEIRKDKDGFLEKDTVDRVVSRVVGFSNGGFYIIDDTIYYATPYMMLDKDGTLLSDRVEIRSININGDTKTDKQVYVTDTHMDDLEWTMYKVDGQVYLVIYVNDTVYSVNASTGKVVGELDSPSSFVLNYEDNYSTSKDRSGDKYRYVFYTRAKQDSDNVSANVSGNAVCMFDITNGNVSVPVNNINNNTFTLASIVDNYLYYTVQTSASLTYCYRQDLRAAWNNNPQDLTNGVSYTSYYACPYGDYIITTNDSGTWVVSHGQSPVFVSEDKIAVYDVYGGYAYYEKSDVLYRFKITNPSINEIATSDSRTPKLTSATHVDFDGQRVYVYTEYEGGNYYLDYIDEITLKQRFVGVFADGETPEAPEQADKYGEDPDVEYIPHID